MPDQNYNTGDGLTRVVDHPETFRKPSPGMHEALAVTLYEHEWYGGSCKCGWIGGGDHASHQADQVISAIRALTPQQRRNLLVAD